MNIDTNNWRNMDSLEATGRQLLDGVERLIHEGNTRRISIKQGDATIAEFPLTLGVVGAVLAPAAAGIGAVAAMVAGCTFELEHTEPEQNEN